MYIGCVQLIYGFRFLLRHRTNSYHSTLHSSSSLQCLFNDKNKMPIIKLMCRTVERKSCLVTLNFNVVFVIVVWVDVYAFYMLIMCGIAFFCSKNYSHSNLFIFSRTSPHNFRVKLFLNFVLHQIQNTSHMLSYLVEEK